MAGNSAPDGMFSVPETPADLAAGGPQYTGRYLVLLSEQAAGAAQKAVVKAAGLKAVASSEDFKAEEFSPEAVAGADALVLKNVGVMVVDGDEDQVAAIAAIEDERKGIEAREPEQICYALPLTTMSAEELAASADYVRGFRDGVSHLADALLHGPGEAESEVAPLAWTETQATWGLQATRAHRSTLTGRSICLAVLDTGMDLRHPDFIGRRIVSRSFISGETAQDGHGHGTHCVGTACGPRTPGQLPRYGVAHEAKIHVGKVLSNRGSGGDGGILAGIDWAMTSKCQVVSMSLGAPVRVGEPPSRVYEAVAQRALRAGTLIIAAAGNDSGKPVSRPANSPSIMAVSALDQRLRLAPFSNVGLNPDGGQIDIAAPGVDVHSSWPTPGRYRRLNGTSMATPHVAGCAALHCQARGATGAALWQMLTASARRLALPSRQVGAGLVQAGQ